MKVGTGNEANINIDPSLIQFIFNLVKSGELSGIKQKFGFKSSDNLLDAAQTQAQQEQARKFLEQIKPMRFTKDEFNLFELAAQYCDKNLDIFSFVLSQLLLANFEPEKLLAECKALKFAEACVALIKKYQSLPNRRVEMLAAFYPILKFLIEKTHDATLITEIMTTLALTPELIDPQEFQCIMQLAIDNKDNRILTAIFDKNILIPHEKSLLPLHCLMRAEEDFANIVEQHYRHLNPHLKDAEGNTPLHLAVMGGHKRSVAKLAQCSNLNDKNLANNSALALASDIDIVKLLVDAGGDINICIQGATDKVLQAKLIHEQELRLPRGLTQPISQTRTSLYKKLVFMGGGIKGLAYLSAIEEAEKLGLISLAECDGFAGTSVGSLPALQFALNINFAKIKTTISESDFTQFFDFVHPKIAAMEAEIKSIISEKRSNAGIAYALIKNVRTLYDCWDIFNQHTGLCHGDKLYQWICARIADGIVGTPLAEIPPELITFEDLAQHPTHFRRLVVYGTNVDTGEAEEYSERTYPKGCIATACRISTGIEVLFKLCHMEVVEIQADGSRKKVLPKKYVRNKDNQIVFAEDKHLRGDGGLFLNYPIGAFDSVSGDHKYNEDVLGFYLVEEQNHSDFEFQQKPFGSTEKTDFGLFTLLIHLLNTALFNQQGDIHKKGPDRKRTIYINTLDIGFTEFGLEEDRRQKLLLEGQKGVHHFIARIRNTPERQLSNTVQTKLFRYGISPGTEGLFCTNNNFKPKSLTVARLLKLYAVADEAELAYLKTTRANPNFTENGISALQVARAWGYEKIAARLLHCNANENVKLLSQAEILTAIPELRADTLIMEGNELALMLPKKSRLVSKIHTEKSIHDISRKMKEDEFTQQQQTQKLDQERQLGEKNAHIRQLERQIQELRDQVAQRDNTIQRHEERDPILVAQFQTQRNLTNCYVLLTHYENCLRVDIGKLRIAHDGYINSIAKRINIIDKNLATQRANSHELLWFTQYQEKIVDFFRKLVIPGPEMGEEQIKAAYLRSLEYLIEQLNCEELMSIIAKSSEKDGSYRSYLAKYQEVIERVMMKLKGITPEKHTSEDDLHQVEFKL